MRWVIATMIEMIAMFVAMRLLGNHYQCGSEQRFSRIMEASTAVLSMIESWQYMGDLRSSTSSVMGFWRPSQCKRSRKRGTNKQKPGTGDLQRRHD